MTKKPRAAHKPRVLRAKPLLVAVGAAALMAGCGDDTTTPSNYDMGIPRVLDMAKAPGDLMGKFGEPPDMTSTD
jgi:hypothetical protein